MKGFLGGKGVIVGSFEGAGASGMPGILTRLEGLKWQVVGHSMIRRPMLRLRAQM